MNKPFFSFVRKEFRHISRDRQTILILLVMPLVMISLFGFALSMEVRGTRVAVFDQQKSQDSRRLCQRIDANRFFTVVAYPEDYTSIEPLLRQGKADVALVIHPVQTSQPGKRAMQILADGSEPNQAQTRVGYLMQIIRHSNDSPVNVRMLFNPQLKSAYNFVPGVIGVILLLICAMMTSISIVREKETGTMEILLASPLPPSYIVVAKLLPYLVVSSVNLVTILLVSYFLLGVPIAGSILLFCAITLLYIIVSLALGLFISTVVHSQLAAMLLSLLMIVPAIYLSGMIFPIESMPLPAAKVSHLIPTRWFIDAARKILIQGVSAHYLIKHFIVLGVEAIVLIAISVKLFKTRLE
ncbi:MAG: ABC transporter permease [Parabacteroides sp.]